MRAKKYTLLAIGILVFALVLVLLISFVARLELSKLKAVSKPIGVIYANASVIASSYFTYSGANNLVQYALLKYSILNATNASAELVVYPSNPVPRIYLVNVSTYSSGTFNEGQVYNALYANLAHYGLIFNSSSFTYIPMQAIPQIQKGSIVIVPSGFIPMPMLENYSQSIFSMLDKGDTIIYVGQAFNRTVSSTGVIFVTPGNVTSELDAYLLETLPASRFLNASALAALSNSTFPKPTFFFMHGFRFGGIAYINSANGTLIAFSNFPTQAWPNANSMANSLASSIYSDFWIQRLAYGGSNVTAFGSGKELGVFTNSSYLSISLPISNATISFLNSTYSLLRLVVQNSSAQVYRVLPFRTKYTFIGEMSMPGTVSDSESIPILINVSSHRRLQLHIDIYNQNLSYTASIPILQTFVGNISIERPFNFSLPGGIYIAYLKNQYDQNYTAALFTVPPLNITPISLNFKNGTFSFYALSGTFPVTSRAQVSLNGAYTEQVSVQGGILNYTLPKGTILSFGTQTFDINMFGTTFIYKTTYSKEIFHIPTFYIELGVVLIGIILLNIVVKPPNRDEYYVDVPSFLPEKKEQIKTKPADVLSLFDKTNYYYHWSYMPLTIEEFKNGVSVFLHYGNMPLSITTANAQLILNELIKEGSVVEEGGYYMPVSWVSSAKHDIEYLVIFRALRDYCVSHAILFTELNANVNADMLMTKNGRQASIIIYSRKSGMRQFEINPRSSTFIVFINEEVKSEFAKKILLSTSTSSQVLKLAIDYEYVKLVSIEHLEDIVF
ncbi:MAG: hypothetical protein ACP5T4_00495 [Candidatus Micrarchaeia archaeon]